MGILAELTLSYYLLAVYCIPGVALHLHLPITALQGRRHCSHYKRATQEGYVFCLVKLKRLSPSPFIFPFIPIHILPRLTLPPGYPLPLLP